LDENFVELLQKISWEFSVLVDAVININKGRYVGPPTFNGWNVDEDRKWMPIDLIQRECQDENLLKAIKEG
jgi:hypothetical protein